MDESAAAADLLATLRKWREIQGDTEVATLLAHASAAMNLYASDWGVDFYNLNIEVQLSDFVRLENRIETIEQSLSRQAAMMTKNWSAVRVDRANVAPQLQAARQAPVKAAAHEDDLARLWRPRRPRVFLSHLSSHKSQVAVLQTNLEARGVTAFVAHRDIRPTRAWQQEIEIALQTMDALVALVTPKFHESDWTDQEIGYALGRGVFVLSVQLGQAPRGFIGRDQALGGDFARPEKLAHEILELLLGQESLRDRFVEGLVIAVEEANSYAGAKAAVALLASAKNLNSDQIARLRTAANENSQVRDAHGVPEALMRLG